MNNKVACFGVPSIFSFKSKVCGNCGEFNECQKQSYSALQEIREYPISTSLLNQHEDFRIQSGQVAKGSATLQLSKDVPSSSKKRATRYALTTEQLARIEELPKKIGNFLEKVWVRGLDRQINIDIEDNKNPFDANKARAYHMAYEVLCQGRAHRSKMSSELMNALGWTYASAYSQVSMIWQIFPELGIATHEGVFLVRTSPRYSDHNT